MTAAVSDNPTGIVVEIEVVSRADWQSRFQVLLPRLERRLRYAFRRLGDEAREEAVQESVCLACRAYARLAVLGRTHAASAASLARYAARQYRSGRRVGSRLNVNDVCSEHCRLRKGVSVERLDRNHGGVWRELLVEDRTVTPAELAAGRIDYATFLAGLSTGQREIADMLASGETTSGAAARLGISAGRISQLRFGLRAAWERFQGSVSINVTRRD